MSAGRAAASAFFHKPVSARAAVVVAGPIANFILAIVIFAGIFMFYGKQTTSARVDTMQPDSAAAAAGFKPGDLVLSIDGRKIDSFADMQRHRQHQRRPGRSRSGSTAAACELTLKATPALKESKDNFGNVHRLGVLGISRSMAPDDIKTEPVDPLTALWMGVEETWFVVDRTMSYLGRRGRRARVGRSARRSDPDRPGLRAKVATAGFVALIASRRRAVGLDRPAEPVSGATARWRSPFVLCHRGGARAAVVRACAGGRVPDRVRARRDADDLCNL